MPEVVEFYRLSGSIDYLLKVLVPSMDEYNAFYTKLTDQIDIFSVATSFSMEEIKQTSSLPLNYRIACYANNTIQISIRTSFFAKKILYMWINKLI